MSLIGRTKTAIQVVRQFGVRWTAARIGYELKRKSGWLRRITPIKPWDDCPLAGFLRDAHLADPDALLDYRLQQGRRFFFNREDAAEFRDLLTKMDIAGNNSGPDAEGLLSAEDIRAGRLRLFQSICETGQYPIAWNEADGRRLPTDQHWSQIDDFALADIRTVWEPNRFGFVYDLVRSYWRTGESRSADLFWELVEDWRESNPPNSGPNWKCGQEISFRVMAWCFGLYGFAGADASSPKRQAKLIQMIAVSAQRIEANFRYAILQQNNHGVSEATGLLTSGLLFPELESARRWSEIGRNELERLGRNLIDEDGSFAQHSANYHRVMLDDFLWAIRLSEINDRPLSNELVRQVGRAAEFLYAIQDVSSGRVPNYGQNDGSQILPLSRCDARDMRPIVAASWYLARRTRIFPGGLWDEKLLWMFGPEALRAEREDSAKVDLQAKGGGVFALRSTSGMAMLHAPVFQHRPSQADLLHVDLWWQGINVATDPGSFSYNAGPPWDNPLAKAIYHNTVTVDGADPMQRVGRFMWLPWARCSCQASWRSPGEQISYVQAEHDGYQRTSKGVAHYRGVLRLGAEHWLIVDRILSSGPHHYRLHWLLPDCSFRSEANDQRLVLESAQGDYSVQVGVIGQNSSTKPDISVVRADPRSPRGWVAPYYGTRNPAVSLAMDLMANSVEMWSLFGPGKIQIDFDDQARRLAIRGTDCDADVDLTSPDNSVLIANVRWRAGATEDHYKIDQR